MNPNIQYAESYFAIYVCKYSRHEILSNNFSSEPSSILAYPILKSLLRVHVNVGDGDCLRMFKQDQLIFHDLLQKIQNNYDDMDRHLIEMT